VDIAPTTPHSHIVLPHALWRGTVRLIRSAPADAVTNMALDEAMLGEAAESGHTLVRLYEWARPTVSFGRNQRCDGIYSQERCDALAVPAVRRMTGGRALLHARELTYSVAAPTSAAPSLRGGYEAINALLVAALRSLRVEVSVAVPVARATSPGAAPCFETPSAGELVVHGRKLVGSAQHRESDAFLQHGSILLDDDQGLLHELALVRLPMIPPPATLHGLDASLTADAVARAIVEAIRGVTTGTIVETFDAALPAHRVAAAASRYADPRWTWRR